jgi:F420-dependent oxidoreductase-like protein
MRVGGLVSGSTVEEITESVQGFADAGCQSAWLTDAAGFDPLTIFAIVGRHVPDIELGTAVVRTHPRHPMELAQQALTVNAAIGRRLTLGIGPSHKPSIEGTWGMSFDRPIRHMREYLSILLPLLRDGSVEFTGETLSAQGSLFIDDGRPCEVLLGALGPQMLHLAGSVADGTVTFMTGVRSLVDYLCPVIAAAADGADRPTPRVVAMLPLCVTDDVSAIEERVHRGLGAMTAMPSYAAAVEREGALPLVAGTRDHVLDTIAALEGAGVTDIVATRIARRDSDEQHRTDELLREVSGGR